MKRLALVVFLSTSAYLVLAQSVPNLINYQGRLTDFAGMPMPPNTYGIQFRLWDTPTGSNILVWAQQQNVVVQPGGVFNVILGSPGGSFVQGSVPAVNDLAFAFTSSNRFLGITVIATNGVAVPSPSEILPRQEIMSVPFALTAASVIPGAIGSQELANGAVGPAQIAVHGIQNSNLAPGIVGLGNLAPRQVGTNVAAGGLAVSAAVTTSTTSFSYVTVSNLTVTITTTGRPVVLMLIPDSISANPDSAYISIVNGGALPNLGCYLTVVADQNRQLGQQYLSNGNGNSQDYEGWIYMPISSVQFLDFGAAAGQHSYALQVKNQSVQFGVNTVTVSGVRLVAYEL